jgi:hypothetical protein
MRTRDPVRIDARTEIVDGIMAKVGDHLHPPAGAGDESFFQSFRIEPRAVHHSEKFCQGSGHPIPLRPLCQRSQLACDLALSKRRRDQKFTLDLADTALRFNIEPTHEDCCQLIEGVDGYGENRPGVYLRKNRSPSPRGFLRPPENKRKSSKSARLDGINRLAQVIR